jgi:hypothetical protein
MTTSIKAPAAKRQTIAEQRKEFRAAIEAVENQREVLVEQLSNAVSMLRQEDIGWAAPGAGQSYNGLSLEDIQHWSGQIRASITGTRDNAPNPHMRNGLMLRHSFIWSGDMHYADVPGSKENKATQGKTNVQDLLDDINNQRLMFAPSARRRREHALYADGLYIAIGNNSNKKDIRPIPLHEITETQRDDLYQDEIVAYRWTREEAVRAPSTRKSGKVVPGALTGERETKSYWVYVDWYTGAKPANINFQGTSEPVLKNYTAFDLHANRPDGQAFGSPDAISALVWARIIRDLIMNGVKMQDALAMFAFKVAPKTKQGQQAAALELGKRQEAGSAAVGDNELTPLNSAGKGYDFGSIGFVVATMAASLHVSGISLSANTALAGSSYGAAKTLDLPGRMAMQTRRAEHIEFDERILRWMGAKDATAYFDNYDDATDEYRAVQAAMLAWTTGTLSPEGFRSELEIVYGRKLMGEIPDGVVVPNNQKQIDDKVAAGVKAAAAVQAAAPDQGKSNGAGDADHAGDLPPKEDGK